MGRKILDLTGQKYGRLTVIEEVARKGYTRKWLCRCECGNETIVTQPNLRNGHTTSCGCVQREKTSKSNTADLTGKKFGKLKVVKRLGTAKNRKAVWLCKCECGNTTEVQSDKLLSGETTSCGCARVEAGKAVQQTLHEELTIDGVVVPYLTRKARSDNRSGVKGVSIITLKSGEKRYKAHITIKGKTIHLGTFETLEEAEQARKKAEEVYHKPYINKLKEEKRHDE
ncbi:hypothetical protein ACFPOH_07370 [Ureibacillus suwonensis]|uniref:AP2 domain-containing protein n=1 Tax=Ureibacillus suwonensis TaxID=313007 RepID=A0ABW0RFE2_9BACL